MIEIIKKIIKLKIGVEMGKLKSKNFDDVIYYNDIPYYNRDNKKLLMDIFEPKKLKGKDLPVVVVIHGGGLVLGNKNISRRFCENLSRKGYLVFSLEYRLVPVVNIYEQLDDICAGMDCVGKQLVNFDVDFNRIHLAADSAGAYLSVYVASMKQSKRLQNVIGLEPSKMRFSSICMISGMFYAIKKDLIGLILAKYIYGKKYKIGHILPYANPGNKEIIKNLPPTYLVTSKSDFLRRHTLKFYNELKKNNMECDLLYYGKNKDLTHSFTVVKPDLKESDEVINKMTAWFENHKRSDK